MKRFYISGNIFRMSFLLAVAIFFATIFSGCKEREEDPNESLSVQFRVNTVNNVSMKAIVTQVGTVQSTKFNPAGTSWSSEPQIVKTDQGAVHLAATGEGAGANSKLIVSIWINGEKKASDTATGINLTAKTVVDFNK